MNIIKDKKYSRHLYNILSYISKDKKSVALNFEKELDKKIENILIFPYKHRKSYYFEDENYRDLIFKGYTIIYKIDGQTIKILDIFKWQNR